MFALRQLATGMWANFGIFGGIRKFYREKISSTNARQICNKPHKYAINRVTLSLCELFSIKFSHNLPYYEKNTKFVVCNINNRSCV